MDFDVESIENSKLTALSKPKHHFEKSPITISKTDHQHLPLGHRYIDDEGNWERDIEIDEEKIRKAGPIFSKRLASSDFIFTNHYRPGVDLSIAHSYREGPEDFSDVCLPEDPTVWTRKLAANSRKSSQVGD